MRDLEDPKLGRLTWVAKQEMLEGRIAGGAGEVELSIEILNEGALKSQLEHATRLATSVVHLEQRAGQFLVDKMLRMKNDGWLSEDEAPLSPEEFLGKVRLGRIDVSDGGAATLIFDDGDVFWGHYITVDLLVDGTLENAGMFG